MSTHQHHSDDTLSRERARDPEEGSPSFWTSKTGLAAIGFMLIAAFLLLSEHRAHALGYLPFLLLLACPLLHMFMHGGHGDHGGRSGPSASRE